MEEIQRLQGAMWSRKRLRKNTDVLRIVDGRGDTFDDLIIDDFAGHWLVQTRAAEFPEWLLAVKQAKSLYWKRLGEKVPPQWMAGEKLEAPFLVQEHGVRYEVDFTSGYSQGLFIDQRDARQRLRGFSRQKSVLNCFAYTCAFGLCAALGSEQFPTMGGAETTNIDLSQRYLDWGWRNYELNNVNPAEHNFFRGDVTDWLERFARKGRIFDIIILDPPTFSRDDDGNIFTIEDGFTPLVRAAEKVLAPKGILYCSTNQQSLAPSVFYELIISGMTNPKAWKTQMPHMPDGFRYSHVKAHWCWREE